MRKSILPPRRWRGTQILIFMISMSIAGSGFLIGNEGVIVMPIVAIIVHLGLTLAAIVSRDLYAPFSWRVMMRNVNRVSLGFAMSFTAAMAAFFAIARAANRDFAFDAFLFGVVMLGFFVVRCGLIDYFQKSVPRKLPKSLDEAAATLDLQVVIRDDKTKTIDDDVFEKIRAIESRSVSSASLSNDKH